MDDKAPLFPSCRLTLSILGLMALLNLFLLRYNISLAIVCMVKPIDKSRPDPVNTTMLPYHNSSMTSSTARSSSWLSHRLPTGNSNDVSSDVERVTGVPGTAVVRKKVYEAEFEWSRKFQGFVLSSYYYGYLVTQYFGGWLAGRVGAKHVLGSGMFLGIIATVVTPPLVRLNPYLIIACRTVLGASMGVFYSCIQNLFGLWAPPLERSILSTITFLGATVGTILALLVSTAFCDLSLDHGWPFTFYASGASALVFYVLWNLLAFSSPETHPRISKREYDYIKTCTGLHSCSERPKFPFWQAIHSVPLWANLVVHTTSTWFSYTAATSLPLYMRDVLHFDIKQNGLYSVIPHLAAVVVSVPLSWFADYLRTKKILSTGAVRKIYQSIACMGPSVLLIILGFLDYRNRGAAVAILTLIYVLLAFSRAGFVVNCQDIAPRFAGELFGVTNTFGTISGIVAPIVVGYLTTNGLREEWQMVFYISAGIVTFGGIVFVIFGKGEVLPWAKAPGDAYPVEHLEKESKEAIMNAISTVDAPAVNHTSYGFRRTIIYDNSEDKMMSKL